MAEPLKHQLMGPEVPRSIAESLGAAYAAFDTDGFLSRCLDGYDLLELTARGQRISDAMAIALPADRAEALAIMLRSVDVDDATRAARQDRDNEHDVDLPAGWSEWRYLAHTRFVADHGLEHFEPSMNALHRLTQLFTAEFAIRPFIERQPEDTLRRLDEWTSDPSEHVRRLVSEGTRPRLPWAGRLREFERDPEPVLRLLEKLKNDESEYVRRSVANNLNDIAKDHPDRVIEVAGRWWSELPAADGPAPDAAGADDDADARRRMVRHGLRTLIKQAHPEALAVMGFSEASPAEVVALRLSDAELSIGEKLKIEVEVAHPSGSGDPEAGALVDLVVHFVKANGARSPKVFKGAELRLAAGATSTVRKTISLAQHSTRTHHAGTHRVEVQLNGRVVAGADFELQPGSH